MVEDSGRKSVDVTGKSARGGIETEGMDDDYAQHIDVSNKKGGMKKATYSIAI